MIKQILLAYDGSEPARRALETAAELAKALDARVDVISVVPVRPGRFPVDPWDDTTVHAAELREAQRLLSEHGLRSELVESMGDPAKTIEHYAHEHGYDAIVIGSRGLDALERVLQGSVSEHVATHADVPVMVVR
jgi:nucleotide-binding universal stress UspA family protein